MRVHWQADRKIRPPLIDRRQHRLDGVVEAVADACRHQDGDDKALLQRKLKRPSKKKRKEYIDLAKEYDIPVKCIYLSTSMEESLYRNNQRDQDKIIPKIAYYMFRKHFETPDENEGFKLIWI